MYAIFIDKFKISFPVIYTLYTCDIVIRNSTHIFISRLKGWGSLKICLYDNMGGQGYNWVNLQSVF